MNNLHLHRVICLTFVLSVVEPVILAGQTFNFIASFNGTNGSHPYSAVIWANDGNLYGATSTGGAYDKGTVFKCTPAGTLTTLHSFNGTDGADPRARLVQASDGNFYGTTITGGANNLGTVFKITSGGMLTTLHSFNGTDGAQPRAGLLQGSDGKLYGTTSANLDRLPNNLGTIFEITFDGTLTTLHSFNGTDGADPRARLVQATDGSFYGTTYSGGATDHGTIFKITSTGTLTTVYSFNHADGANPIAGLVQARDGNFYGTTFQGGHLNPGLGSVFKITPQGTLTTLHFFDDGEDDGSFPYTELVEAADGNFYGTSHSLWWAGGTVFQVTPAGAFTTLHWFGLGLNGFNPRAELVVAPDLSFYGTTISGGSANKGTIFKMSMPLVLPVRHPKGG